MRLSTTHQQTFWPILKRTPSRQLPRRFREIFDRLWGKWPRGLATLGWDEIEAALKADGAKPRDIRIASEMFKRRSEAIGLP